MRVETRDADGNPICYVCEHPVARAGEACSAECYLHLVSVVESSQSVAEMDAFMDHTEQDWFDET